MKFGGRQISPKNEERERTTRRQIRNSFFVIRSSNFDPVSLLLTCPADSALKDVEASLSALRLTLGYRPARTVRTIREALARRVPNLLAERYGEIDDLCVALRAFYKGGAIKTKNVPRSATGPDFKKLLAGDGVRLVEVTLRVSPRPEACARFQARWKKKNGADEFLKLFWAAGIRPAVLRRKTTKTLDIALEGLGEIVRAETNEIKSLIRKTRGAMHARP